MKKFWRYFFRAMSVTSLISNVLPAMVEDKKITLPEMVNVVEQIFGIFGWKCHIEVAEDEKTKVFEFVIE